MEQASIAVKVEALMLWEENKWTTAQAAKAMPWSRGTLDGWKASKEMIYSATVDPLSRRTTTPGPPPPTNKYETALVLLIQEKFKCGAKMSRNDIIANCGVCIPEFIAKSQNAKNKWVQRFVKRHELESYLTKFSQPTRKTRARISESTDSDSPQKRSRHSAPSPAPEGIPDLFNLVPNLPPEASSPACWPDRAARPEPATPTLADQAACPEPATPTLADQTPTQKPSVLSLADEAFSSTPAVLSMAGQASSSTPAVPSLAGQAPSFTPAVPSMADQAPSAVCVSHVSAGTDQALIPACKLQSSDESSEVDFGLDSDDDFDAISITSADVPAADSNSHLLNVSQTPPHPQAIQNNVVCSTTVLCFSPELAAMEWVVREQDLATLGPTKWLNDVVMTFVIREQIPTYGSTFCFDCQFFRSIHLAYLQANRSMEAAYASCAGITATFDWVKYRHVFIPVWMDEHWSFVVAQNPVEVYPEVQLRSGLFLVDSYGAHDLAKVTNLLRDFFAFEKQSRYATKHSRNFTRMAFRTTPKQANTWDCGVFVLYFMKYVSDTLLRQPNTRLLLDLRKILELPRSNCFNARQYRKDLIEFMRNRDLHQGEAVSI